MHKTLRVLYSSFQKKIKQMREENKENKYSDYTMNRF